MKRIKPERVADGLTATPFKLSLVNRARAGRKGSSRKVKRSAMKTLTYGVMHFCVAVIVAYALTRDVRIALSIGLIEPVVQTFAYTLHELGWSRADKSDATEPEVEAQTE